MSDTDAPTAVADIFEAVYTDPVLDEAIAVHVADMTSEVDDDGNLKIEVGPVITATVESTLRALIEMGAIAAVEQPVDNTTEQG